MAWQDLGDEGGGAGNYVVGSSSVADGADPGNRADGRRRETENCPEPHPARNPQKCLCQAGGKCLYRFHEDLLMLLGVKYTR